MSPIGEQWKNLKRKGMNIFKKIWKKVEDFVVKTQTDRKTGELFLAVILGLGATGIIFCLAWFACLVMAGMPLGWIIFDIAIIVFCAWAVIKGVIPMAKEAFNGLEKLDKKYEHESDNLD